MLAPPKWTFSGRGAAQIEDDIIKSWIHAGFPGAASVYYYCDDMPSVVMYEYQWDAS